jgi:hypothetical protein
MAFRGIALPLPFVKLTTTTWNTCRFVSVLPQLSSVTLHFQPIIRVLLQSYGALVVHTDRGTIGESFCTSLVVGKDQNLKQSTADFPHCLPALPSDPTFNQRRCLHLPCYLTLFHRCEREPRKARMSGCAHDLLIITVQVTFFRCAHNVISIGWIRPPNMFFN